MSILLVTPPSPLPVNSGDYQAQNNLSDARLVYESFPVNSSNVVKGARFYIKGSTFIASSATAISGTTSNYVKLTVSGSEATPEFIADLNGVTWSDVYNCYLDSSNDFVFFDEMKAYILGDITTPKLFYNKIISDVTNQVLKKTSDVEFNSVNTGQGANSLYPMDQPLRSSDPAVFATINTGQGANNLYPMDQDVRKINNPTFAGLKLTGSFEPVESPAEGSFTVTTTPQFIPRGIYNLAFENFGSDHVIVEIYISGGWRTFATSSAPDDFSKAVYGCFVSSGGDDKVRIYSSSGSLTVRYQRY